MALLEIQADFHALVSVLTRIADALERAYPPTMAPVDDRPRGKESLSRLTPKDRWQKEQDRKNQQDQESDF